MTAIADARAYWTPTEADLPLVPAVAEHYWASAAAPHRAWAVDTIRQLAPASVLDLGCQCGPNLKVLREAFPELRLIGLDVNVEAMAWGRERLPGVEFREGAVPDALRAMDTGSVDVVLSTYCLAYQGPEQIGEALLEALRVARHAVVIIEPMREEPVEVRIDGNDYVEWRHNYLAVVEHVLNSRAWDRLDHGLHVRYEPHAPYKELAGVLVLEHVHGVARGE